MNTQYAFETLREEYELTDENVAEYRGALSFDKEYSEYVKDQAFITMQSIEMGQSVLAIGELMRPLFNATHKFVTSGYEVNLPGVEYFEAAAKVAFEAVQHINEIAAMTEEYAATMLSCDDTVDVSYM